LFDPASYLRVVVFGVIYAGLEYRYVNRREEEWTKRMDGFFEKPVFWAITPYHLYFLLPLFVTASFALPITAWVGNAFTLAVLEDVAYFVWRGKLVAKGEWTTTLMGSFTLGGLEIPLWWPLDIAAAAVLFWAPL
jgi:hypothetical protein